LNLNYCRSLTDVSVLSGLTRLTYLNLSDCDLQFDVSVLSGLTKLTELNLRDCKSLADVTVLSGLTKLTSLDLDGCDEVRSLAPLAHLRSLESLKFTSRRVQSIEVLREIPSLRTLEEFNPPEVAELLAHTSVLRSDRASISEQSKNWLHEAKGWDDGALQLRERFAVTLGEAFSRLGEHAIERSYEEYLQGHAEFSAAPWRAWLAGTRTQSGWPLMRHRVERQEIAASTPGCIGGICAVLAVEGDALEEIEWSKSWLDQMETFWRDRSKDLLPVSAEVCLAYARLGESAALARWLKRFTDPSDPGVLDPVQAALAKFQLTNRNLPAAENHIFSIHAPVLRDPVLGDLVGALADSDAEGASAKLLLIEDPGIRTELAKQVASQPGASETTLHRLAVAMADSPRAVAELISAIPDVGNKTFIETLSIKLQTERTATLRRIAEALHRKAEEYLGEALAG